MEPAIEAILKGLTEQEVSGVFADPQSQAARRWIEYWSSTESRNKELLGQFRRVISLGFQGKTVLDVGCGSAGLASFVLADGGRYVGADYSPYVLRMGRHWLRRKGLLTAQLLRASGSRLPFRAESFDYIFAFDVIEHLELGMAQQLDFLKELRRLIRPIGMIFLTTPNRWHPFEGHTFLYFPQYLPLPLADAYIRRRNPGFLQEHGSFRSIKLLTPKELERLLRQSGLSFLHRLPCALDIADLPPAKRMIYRMLDAVGLSWYPMQEFWGCLARSEDRELLRVKCSKQHHIALREAGDATAEFSNRIDFSLGPEAHQLDEGWFPHEIRERSFRWTGPEATAWLQAEGNEDWLSMTGYCNGSERPSPVTLDVYCDGHWIGRHCMVDNERFELKLLLPWRLRRLQICRLRLSVAPCHTPGGADGRKLGILMFAIELHGTPELSSRIDFSRGPETHQLDQGWFGHESGRRGFRWIGAEASAWLRAEGDEECLFLSGYCDPSHCPSPVTLNAYCDGHWIGRHRINESEQFQLRLPLPYRMRRLQVCRVRLVVHPCFTPGGTDKRELGITLFEMALEKRPPDNTRAVPESDRAGRLTAME